MTHAARPEAKIIRAGRRYFVQTPNKRFPLEPHFLFPFFLLTRKKFAALFPGATIHEERILRLTKSFVAFKGW